MAIYAVELIVVLALLAATGLLLWVRAGQRSNTPTDPLPPHFRDHESNWRGGIFYVNREDPALLVPRRSRLGWTLNFGHPRAWLVLVAIMLIPLLSTLLAAAK